jgi:hypothetical protein
MGRTGTEARFGIARCGFTRFVDVDPLTAVVIASWIALLLSLGVTLQAQGERPRHRGGENFTEPSIRPELLQPADISPDIWPIVQQINRSGWVWTTESWDGHGNKPVLLGLQTDQIGRLFTILTDVCLAENRNSPSPQVPNVFMPRLALYSLSKFLDLGHYQMQILFETTEFDGHSYVVTDRTEEKRARALALLTKMAAKIRDVG